MIPGRKAVKEADDFMLWLIKKRKRTRSTGDVTWGGEAAWKKSEFERKVREQERDRRRRARFADESDFEEEFETDHDMIWVQKNQIRNTLQQKQKQN